MRLIFFIILNSFHKSKNVCNYHLTDIIKCAKINTSRKPTLSTCDVINMD
uniref:Uncharacterized protein n=1 Tax=Bacteriophage sp. TaxID=38018 RepID=A0A8D9UHJ0_9VIRU|nr:MAG TPA: hypothetical protein [Bacteriophage sp.]